MKTRKNLKGFGFSLFGINKEIIKTQKMRRFINFDSKS